jgi:hypothetical protein
VPRSLDVFRAVVVVHTLCTPLMLGGFNFKRLLELHPSKADKLASLREHVKSTAATIRELKVRFVCTILCACLHA